MTTSRDLCILVNLGRIRAMCQVLQQVRDRSDHTETFIPLEEYQQVWKIFNDWDNRLRASIEIKE